MKFRIKNVLKKKRPRIWCRDESRPLELPKVPRVPKVWRVCMQQLLKNYYYTNLSLEDFRNERDKFKEIVDLDFPGPPLYKVVLLTAGIKLPVFFIFKFSK